MEPCCEKPVIGSNWAFGLGETTGLLRVDNIHCETCGAVYELDVEMPISTVQRDAIALRVVPIRRRPS